MKLPPNYHQRCIILLWLLGIAGIFFSPSILAQTKKIDSLKILVANARGNSQKITAIFNLCEERLSLNTDSLYNYALQAKALAKALKKEEQVIEANYYAYTTLFKNGLYDSVISASENSISWLKKKGSSPGLLNRFLLLKGNALLRNNQYKEAISFYFEVLHQAETNNDTLMQVKAKNSIGWANMELNQNSEALLWFYKALATSKIPDFSSQFSPLYSNIASTYNNIGQYDSAFYYIEKCLQGSRQREELTYLCNALNIRADIFMNVKKTALAEKDLNEGLEIRKLIGDPFYIVSDITQLSNFYATSGQYKKGVAAAEAGLQMATQYNLTAKLPILYAAMAENYKAAGDFKKYSLVQEKILALRDSMYQKNSAEELANFQTKYDVQKKENIIIQQKLNIISKDYWYYGTLAFFSFLLVLIFIVYKNYKKRQNIKLEKILEKQQLQETIAVLKAEEKERKRIAADLHDNLGAYTAALAANIRLFKNNTITNNENTTQLEANVKGMISELDNTIWVLKKESQLLTEISDRIKIWVQKIMSNYPAIAYDFYEEIETDPSLSPTLALHLFHIIKECVNNAIKHSNCSSINIGFAAAKHWQVTVADNGLGFNMNSIKNGNGIANLQNRAGACGWKIDWQTINGTTVVIQSA